MTKRASWRPFFYGIYFLLHLKGMKRIIYFFFFVLFTAPICAQSTVVEVKLEDSRSGDAIRGAKIVVLLADSTITRVTNSYGLAYFYSHPGIECQFSLRHFKYEEKSYSRKIPPRLAGDTIRYVFTMDYIRNQNLGEVVVAAPGVPVVHFGSDRVHVEDYEFLQNGEVLLLTYPKNLKKGHELIQWDGTKVKSRFVLEGHRVNKLVRDFRGNPHVICEDAIFGVYLKNGKLGIGKVDPHYFMSYVAPIIDTNEMRLYFSNFNKDYPAFDYFSFDRLDSVYQRIIGIQDDLMMELYRSEYKWADVRAKLWAKNKELQTGVDAEIWIGANYFTQSIYYKELYAPLFQRNDSLFVFDYYRDQLRIFDETGARLDSVAIDHHYDKRSTGWQNKLIQDRVTGQVYALFDRSGFQYIGWVDARTGKIKEQVRLRDRFAEKIQVYNNHIYYIYRPFESAQKKYVYKNRLPYNFGSAKVQEGDLSED